MQSLFGKSAVNYLNDALQVICMFKRGISFIMFLILAASALATDYYVDASNGNDNNNGLSTSSAWETIHKVNSVTFQPGDRILFKKGGKWHGQITVHGSGTDTNPITFSSYGSGAKPIIDAAEKITGWTHHSGNIYKANVGFNVQQVFLDGDFMDLAYHPNTGYFKADTDTCDGCYYIIDNDLTLSSSELVGAGIVVHTRVWEWEYSEIYAYDENEHKISYRGGGPSMYSIRYDTKYFVTNKQWMLDSPGEWYHGGDELYAWMPDNSNPSSHTIEASRYQYGIYGNENHNIVVDGLEIRHAADTGVYFRMSYDIIIKNCEIYDTGSYKFRDIWNEDGRGIYFWEKQQGNFTENKALIADNIIKNAFRGGIDKTRYRNMEMSGNLIENMGLTSQQYLSKATGIGGSSYTHHNIVKNIAYIGIAGGSKTKYNYVNNTCLTVLDGGGIYVAGNVSYKRWIVGNVVENSGDDIMNDQTMAVYLDNDAKNVQVINNTVITSRRGIHIHSGDTNTIRGNTIYGCRYPISLQKTSWLVGPTNNNIWEENIAVSSIDDYLVFFANYKDHNHDFGQLDNNIYSSPRSDPMVFECLRNPFEENEYSLGEWKDARDQDQNSVFVPQPDGTIIIVNRGFSPQSISKPDGRNYKYLDNTAVSWPVTLKALSSAVLVVDGGVCTPVCYQDSDCGTDPCKTYTCHNPGVCSAYCSSDDITSCIDDDNCCPSGCDNNNDNDCTSTEATLIGHWTMDSGDIVGGAVVDRSGNGNDATIHGATQGIGRIGGALDFDGNDDYAATPITDLFAWQSQASASVWIRPGSQTEWAGVLQYRDNTGWAFVMEVRESGVPRGGVKTTSGMQALDSPTVIPLDKWTHFVFTYNGNTMKIYLDGQLDSTRSFSGNLEDVDRPLFIGRNPQDGVSFNGAIDDVRVYSGVLSDDEILNLYDCHPADSDCSGCIEMGELMSYIELWKQNQVVIGDLMEAIAVWKECS